MGLVEGDLKRLGIRLHVDGAVLRVALLLDGMELDSDFANLSPQHAAPPPATAEETKTHE